MSLHPFVKCNAVAFLDMRSVYGGVPRFEDCVHGNVNLRAFRCSMYVSIYDITIFDDVTHICCNVHEEAEAMVFHTHGIRVGELDAHAYKSLTIHGLA
jgi:hypothetical protein